MGILSREQVGARLQSKCSCAGVHLDRRQNVAAVQTCPKAACAVQGKELDQAAFVKWKRGWYLDQISLVRCGSLLTWKCIPRMFVFADLLCIGAALRSQDIPALHDP